MNQSSHLFPSFLAKPVSLIPGRLHAALVSRALNRMLKLQIDEGELDFMNGRRLRVEVMDAGIGFVLGFDGTALFPVDARRPVDLVFRGNVHDFLLLAARREDSDTLFFQRRLKIEGDTEMGLAIKNFLDSIEVESLPWYRQLDGLLQNGLNFYERVT